MVRVTLDSLVPSTPPADGWKVEYRIKGTTGAYTVPAGSPYSSFPIVFDTTDAGGTLYEVNVWRDCGVLESTKFNQITPCNCTDGTYTSTGTDCRKVDSVSPTITFSNYCLAISQNGAYSNYGTRIYNPGFNASTLFIAPATSDAFIYGYNTNNFQWANTTSDATQGPMNREGVWIDSDCDGNKDGLGKGIGSVTSLVAGSGYTNGTYTAVSLTGGSGTGAKATVIVSGGVVTSVIITTTGVAYSVSDVISASNTNVGGTGSGFSVTVASVTSIKVTLSFVYANAGAARQIFIGIAADNQFKLVVNGTDIVDTGTTADDKQFKFWHVIPVNIITGTNYFNCIATGDGSVNDAIAMVGYDNTATQIIAATADAQLSILFKSSSLRGQHIDIATCASGYSLDTSGGQGSYTCTKTLIKVCNSAS